MDHGVIGMPFDMAMGDEVSRRQFYSRAQAILAKRDQLRAALSAVTAERDAANSRLHEVAVACAEAEQERDQLRAEVEAAQADAERYLWASSGVHEAETLVSIVNCHGGYAEKVAERVDVYREAAMAAKEA